MSAEDSHSGIPTRAIHEAYLNMQMSLKEYRQAKDQQNQYDIEDAHGELQQNVLTFYDLLRPHLKHENTARGYWDGELPSYPTNGGPPDPVDGKGIIQVQKRREPIQLNGIDTRQLNGLKEWHKALDLNGDARVADVYVDDDMAVITTQEYQKGLRHLDEWETKYKRKVIQKEGFMSDKTETVIEKQRIPIDRLKRAARELSDAADTLGLLAHIDAEDLPVDEL